MTLPQVYDLFEFWRDNPPESEIALIFARVFTSWRPPSDMTEGKKRERQQRSLEDRWKAGYMNVKQLWEAMGGAISPDPGAKGGRLIGADLPGIGLFPGAHK